MRLAFEILVTLLCVWGWVGFIYHGRRCEMLCSLNKAYARECGEAEARAQSEGRECWFWWFVSVAFLALLAVIVRRNPGLVIFGKK